VSDASRKSRIEAGVRQELRAIEPNLPVFRMDTLEDQLDDVLAQERLIATLSVFFLQAWRRCWPVSASMA